MDAILQQAEAGDAEAQYRAGQLLVFTNPCMSRNPVKAVAWYEKAANQGHSTAMLRLAPYYRFGTEGVGRDIDRALSLYRQAAAQGEVEAMRVLGRMYHSGRDVPKDLAEAEKWFRKAAAKDDPSSQLALKKILKEKNPERWAQEEKRLKEERKRAKEKRRAEAKERRIALSKQRAQEARKRFDVIHLSVTEAEETKQLRAQAPKTSAGLMRSTGRVIGATVDGALAPTVAVAYLSYGSTLWVHPVALGAGAVLGLIDGVNKQLKKRTSKAEKTEIQAAVKSLNRILADEKVEQSTRAQMLALAESRQAKGLLITGPVPGATAHRLDIEIQDIGIMEVGKDPRAGRLWLAAQAKLSGSEVDGGVIQQRFCYGGASARGLVWWAKDDAKAFRKDLQLAYGHLSGQILTDMIGLAKDPAAATLWEHTEKACSVEPERSKVQSNSMAQSKK